MARWREREEGKSVANIVYGRKRPHLSQQREILPIFFTLEGNCLYRKRYIWKGIQAKKKFTFSRGGVPIFWGKGATKGKATRCPMGGTLDYWGFTKQVL